MISSRMYVEDGEYELWIGPAGDLEAENIKNAFIAGTGPTREQAVAAAVRELEAVTRALQVPPKRCDHKFIDSTFCLKCGWSPDGSEVA